MASHAVSSALTKRLSSSTDMALMPPPPPPKRMRRPPTVIGEHEYTSALSHIIARDFFPGLLETESQQDYLDALDAGDEEWIEEAGRRVKQVMTPVAEGTRGRRGVSLTLKYEGFGGDTPSHWWGDTPRFSTPSRTPAQEAESHGKRSERINAEMGLTAFQARYTSEDNESFNALLDKQNAKRQSKYRWLWNSNKLPSARRLAQAASQHRLLDHNAATSNDPNSISRDSQALVLKPSDDPDDRPAMVEAATKRRDPKNSLMFTPEDMELRHPDLSTQAQTAHDASHAPPKAVRYINTRLPASMTFEAEVDQDAIPPSPSISAIDAAIAGRPWHHTTSSTSNSADDTSSETPRVNGYSFVDEDPAPSELAVGAYSSRPAAKMTSEEHDELLGQIIRSRSERDGASTDSEGFKIRESSKRENLHHAMVEKTAKAKRAPPQQGRLEQLRGAGSEKTPTPKFASSPRVSLMRGRDPDMTSVNGIRGSMTPAGQALFGKIGMAGSKEGGGVWGDSKRRSEDFTPTPLKIRKVT